MTPHERGETIAELLALRSRIHAHLFAVVADADRDDVAAFAGATTTANWVRAQPRGSPAPRPPAWCNKPGTMESHQLNPCRPWPRA